MAIALHVLLTYPAHHSSSCLSSLSLFNPSRAPSSNCFTCLTHIPSTPGYSSSCLSSSVIISNSSNPSGAPSGNCLFKQPIGNPERQLFHMSYSHTQHTWVFFLMPISSLSLFLIQATPREPRAAIASRVLLTYPAHLGILPHAYLLVSLFNSSNPPGALSGNYFS